MGDLRRCALQSCRRALPRDAPGNQHYCSDHCRFAAFAARQKSGFPESTSLLRLRDWLLRETPPHALGYSLCIQPDLAGPWVRFPDPTRRTLRADGARRKTPHFSLRPTFEPPMVPRAGDYLLAVYDGLGSVIQLPKLAGQSLTINEIVDRITFTDGQQRPVAVVS